MLLGRFGYIIPVLAIAGQLARAPRQSEAEGDFPVSGPLFITLLIVTVLLMGVSPFLPVLALGPVAEHLEPAGRCLLMLHPTDLRFQLFDAGELC